MCVCVCVCACVCVQVEETEKEREERLKQWEDFLEDEGGDGGDRQERVATEKKVSTVFFINFNMIMVFNCRELLRADKRTVLCIVMHSVT